MIYLEVFATVTERALLKILPLVAIGMGVLIFVLTCMVLTGTGVLVIGLLLPAPLFQLPRSFLPSWLDRIGSGTLRRHRLKLNGVTS